MAGLNPTADYRPSMYLPTIVLALALAVGGVVGGIILLA
jgi:hypothetical protein